MSTIEELGERAPLWLREAKTADADVEIVDGLVIWKSGVWKGGVWKRGVWKGGVWKGGVWESGVWEGGVWEGGTWRNGTWRNGTWRNGFWWGGTWERGVWEDGSWCGGTWENGTWTGGCWGRGHWKGGVWKGGHWACDNDTARLHAHNAGVAIPKVPQLDAQILAAIEAGGALDMSEWHTCKTTHCRAGWAITLAGAKGRKLERLLGPHAAGALIYEASTGRVPDFYARKFAALEDIRKCAKAATRVTL